MEFKKDDWAFYDYKLVQIQDMDEGRVTEVSDGTFRSGGYDLNVRPLTLRNNSISDYWQYYDKTLRDSERGANLNWPDIHRYFVSLWLDACDTTDRDSLIAIQDRLKEFVGRAIEQIRDKKQIAVGGVGLFR